eukprot:scaffold22_cov50-Attheya_sp.AAC.5
MASSRWRMLVHRSRSSAVLLASCPRNPSKIPGCRGCKITRQKANRLCQRGVTKVTLGVVGGRPCGRDNNSQEDD